MLDVQTSLILHHQVKMNKVWAKGIKMNASPFPHHPFLGNHHCGYQVDCAVCALSVSGLFHMEYVLQVHPCYHKWQDILFKGWVIFQYSYICVFICIHISHFLHLSITWHFVINAILIKATVSAVICLRSDFISFGYIHSSEIARSRGSPIVYVLRNLHTAFLF